MLSPCWNMWSSVLPITLGGLSPPCSTRPPLSRCTACPALPGEHLRMAGLHGPCEQLVSGDVPPLSLDKVRRIGYLGTQAAGA